MAKEPRTNSYKQIVEKIFFEHWHEGDKEFEFDRKEIALTADRRRLADAGQARVDQVAKLRERRNARRTAAVSGSAP